MAGSSQLQDFSSDELQDSVDTDQLALLEAQLDEAKAKVAAFSDIARFDGTVAELNTREGSSINAGEIAVTVANFSSWVVTTTDLIQIDVMELVFTSE